MITSENLREPTNKQPASRVCAAGQATSDSSLRDRGGIGCCWGRRPQRTGTGADWRWWWSGVEGDEGRDYKQKERRLAFHARFLTLPEGSHN